MSMQTQQSIKTGAFPFKIVDSNYNALNSVPHYYAQQGGLFAISTTEEGAVKLLEIHIDRLRHVQENGD